MAAASSLSKYQTYPHTPLNDRLRATQTVSHKPTPGQYLYFLQKLYDVDIFRSDVYFV